MRIMKDSEVEWIGKIPEDWMLHRMKYAYYCLDGKRIPLDASQRTRGPYPYWGAGDVMDYIDKYIFDEEIVLLGEDGAPFFDKSRPVSFLINEKVWVNNHIHVLKARKEICYPKYLTYYLNAVDYGSYINGSILNKLTQSNMDSIVFVHPRIDEQIRISNYIESKCANIDALIAAKEKSNALLKEQRQSIIYEAVTKGLDPSAPMKDSGVEWIGDIPEKWTLKKIKFCFDLIAGATPKSSEGEYWDGEIVWITPADFKTEDVYVSSGHKNITEDGLNSCATTIIPGNSLIFSKRAPVGLIAINTVPLCTNQGCIGCIPHKSIDSKFYYYVLSVFSEQFDLLASGTTFKEISAEVFANFEIPYISFETQNQISDYLDKKCAEIDSLISANNSTISKLKEYRQSMIYEAVTGKVEI